MCACIANRNQATERHLYFALVPKNGLEYVPPIVPAADDVHQVSKISIVNWTINRAAARPLLFNTLLPPLTYILRNTPSDPSAFFDPLQAIFDDIT